MYLKIRVLPEAKKEKCVATKKDSFEISVRDKAKRGEANRSALRLLKNYLGFNQGILRIVSGQHSPRKIVEMKIEVKKAGKIKK